MSISAMRPSRTRYSSTTSTTTASPVRLEVILETMQDKEAKRFYAKKLAGATEQSAHEKEFAKLTFTSGATPRIVDQPPLIFHRGGEEGKQDLQIARTTMMEYRKNLSLGVGMLLDRFAIVDVAYKVVGVGSVGTVCGASGAIFQLLTLRVFHQYSPRSATSPRPHSMPA